MTSTNCVVNLHLVFTTACFATALAVAGSSAQPPNTLSEAEKQAGWRLLFDGQTTAGWRNFGKSSVTATNAWIVREGWLVKLPRVRGGDKIGRAHV